MEHKMNFTFSIVKEWQNHICVCPLKRQRFIYVLNSSIILTIKYSALFNEKRDLFNCKKVQHVKSIFKILDV